MDKIHLMISNNIIFKVADIVFALYNENQIESISLEPIYKDFLCAETPSVKIKAYFGDLPRILLQEDCKLFDSEMVWSLYRANEQNIFLLKLPAYHLLYRVAIFNNDFQQGEVYSSIPKSGEALDGLLPNPFEFPLSEVLMICLLAQERGLMIHACGIDDSGRGYLFAGNSTHGKSTMAGLWKDHVILNDDRIVLRWREGRFWMYGTPWHGDYTAVSPNGVPVEKIFFLRHSDENSILRHDGIAAASMLLTRCFPPLWDADGMRFTLDFCAQIANEVPCYELGFVPDKNIIDFVRCAK